MKNTDLEKIYRDLPIEDIPWNVSTPPDALVDLVTSGKIKPCKAIDMGCGAGNYAIYLASLGFEMTGFDNSKSAIEIAKSNAKKKRVECDFRVADVLGMLVEVQETFDFVYDWHLLHQFYPKQRKPYCKNVYKILNSGGKYLSVCFSEKNQQFGGAGKYRTTSLGTRLYFSSEAELKRLFDNYFQIQELKIIEVPGKSGPHHSVYAFMTKE